jgi:Uma2 family endonuclease
MVVLGPVGWVPYVTLSDAVANRHNPRMLYLDGDLSLLTTCRHHDRYAEFLNVLVVFVASGIGLTWETAGQSTFRREKWEVGIEGDRTYYFGGHAEIMKGPVEIDLSTQPPPDLAIEVEVTHPADIALSIWGRLGVPEVWRYRAKFNRLDICSRHDDESYRSADESRYLPGLRASDIEEQMKLADSLGSSEWFSHMQAWVREVFLPREWEMREHIHGVL